MRSQTLSSGLRVTLNATELGILLDLARRGAGSSPSPREAELIDAIEAGAEDLRARRASASAKRRADRDRAHADAVRQYGARLGEWALTATLGDWIDNSADPDFERWQDLGNPEIEQREQGEIRRNVWRFYLTRGSAGSDDFEILGGATRSSSRAELLDAAQKMLDKQS